MFVFVHPLMCEHVRTSVHVNTSTCVRSGVRSRFRKIIRHRGPRIGWPLLTAGGRPKGLPLLREGRVIERGRTCPSRQNGGLC